MVLVEFIREVQKLYSSLNTKSPLIIHCRYITTDFKDFYSELCIFFCMDYFQHTVQLKTLARCLIWQFSNLANSVKITKLYFVSIDYCMYTYGTKNSDRYKFKFHQYLLRANLPNLILSKLSRYTVSLIFYTNSIVYTL